MLWRGTWVNAGPWVASRSEREKECHGAWGTTGTAFLTRRCFRRRAGTL